MKEKELKFIHITKCAGSFIEELGKSNNIDWGKYHKEYGFWHNYLITRKKEIKDKYNWFMIVRNPYDRILSEYYCMWRGIGQKNIRHTKKQFNQFLINKINNRTPSTVINYHIDFHYCEQYKYLDPSVNIEVIKFENMYQELARLFKKYNLNITIPEKKVNSRQQRNRKLLFTTHDFSPELIKLINKVYDKDFKIFNYEKRII